MQSAVFAWSPKTAAVQCLDDEANAALCCLAAGCPAYASWAPSGRHPLSFGVQLDRSDKGQQPGWVAIADVVTGRIIAQSLYGTVFKWGYEQRLSIVWHPSSRGIIFQDDTEVQDLGCFHHAGFATGILPALARMHAGGFFADASHLVAQLYSLPSRWVEGFALVRCSIDGSQICLERAQNLMMPVYCSKLQIVGWEPGSLTLVMQTRCKDGTPQPLVLEVGGAEVPGIPIRSVSKFRPAQAITQ